MVVESLKGRGRRYAFLLIAGLSLLAIAIWLRTGEDEAASGPKPAAARSPQVPRNHDGNRSQDSSPVARTGNPEGDGKGGDGPLTSFGTSGVTTKAIEELNLTDDEVEKLDRVYAEIQKEVEEDFAKRIRVVDFRAYGKGYYGNYYIDSREDGGVYFLDKLKAGIDGIVEELAAEKLKKSVNENMFEDMLGQYDAEVEIEKTEAGGGVRMRVMNPKTGREVNNKFYDLQYFKKASFFPVDVP